MSAQETYAPNDKPTLIERRHQRLAPQPCSSCGSADTSITSRTNYVVYLRCGNCGAVWSEPKPALNRWGRGKATSHARLFSSARTSAPARRARRAHGGTSLPH